MTAPRENKIIISPIGTIDSDLIDPVSREIQRIFDCRTEEIALLEQVDFAFDPGRGQYHSTLILEKLASLAPVSALKVLGLTRVDLFIPILTHVYGEAQLGGKACIISTCRLKEDLSPVSGGNVFQCRVVKEAVHELGHTFNLRHCKEQTCIMHYCRRIRDVDRKSDQLCRYCRILLQDETKRLARHASPAL